MNIQHVLENMHPAAGGPAWVMAHLMGQQLRQGLDSRVSFPETANRDGIDTFIQETIGGECVPAFQGVDSRSRSCLTAVLDGADGLHCHGVWAQIVLQTAKIAQKSGVPYIVRPAGMLEPWSLSQKRWKKKLALAFWYRAMLERASVLQATSVMEAEQFRALGFKNPIALIPNGVDVQTYDITPDRTCVENRWPETSGKKWLLFLSRIHPKKGLMALAECWSKLHSQFPDWHLLVVGPTDDEAYEAQVLSELDRSGARAKATFMGSVFGEQKTQILLNSELFALPTFSENFGVVIAEAMAARVPVITTRGTPWSDLERHQCGWWIEVDELFDTLRDALERTDDDRRQMGERGRAYIQANFAWPVIGQAMLKLYRWLLEGGDAPPFLVCSDQPVGEVRSEYRAGSD